MGPFFFNKGAVERAALFKPLLKMNYRCIAKTFLIAGELCCGRSMDDIANLLLCEV
jgi:hypothetical protein